MNSTDLLHGISGLVEHTTIKVWGAMRMRSCKIVVPKLSRRQYDSHGEEKSSESFVTYVQRRPRVYLQRDYGSKRPQILNAELNTFRAVNYSAILRIKPLHLNIVANKKKKFVNNILYITLLTLTFCA